jgi:hypothetical protein
VTRIRVPLAPVYASFALLVIALLFVTEQNNGRTAERLEWRIENLERLDLIQWREPEVVRRNTPNIGESL